MRDCEAEACEYGQSGGGHADTALQTTMNVYGQAMTTSKRETNSKVEEIVLKPIKASA